MENRPSLSEVKEYFKDAKKIESAEPCHNGLIGRISRSDKRGIHFWGKEYWFFDKKKMNIMLWSPIHGYAKILSYKKPKEETKTYVIKQETGMDSITINDVKYIKEDKDSYKITTEQILKYNMKDEFPEVFENKLTVGKWYKKTWKDGDVDLFPVYEIVQNGNILDKGNYFRNGKILNKFDIYGNISCLTDSRVVITEATEQEVTEVLIKEVKKRYKAGDYVEKIHRFSNKYITGNNPGIIVDSDYKVWYGGCIVFKDGQWAEIIPTLTIQEAEAKLDAKIV